MEQHDYVSADEIAEEIGVSPSTVRRWRTQGRLPGVKFVGSVRFRREDVEAFLSQLSDQGEEL